MTRWNNFLASLATRGGAIFILFVLAITDISVTMHIVHHGEDSSMMAGGLVATLGGFTGALLLALKGSSDTTSITTETPTGTTTATATTGDSQKANP